MSNNDCCHSSKKLDMTFNDVVEVGLDGRRRHGLRFSNVAIPNKSSSTKDDGDRSDRER